MFEVPLKDIRHHLGDESFYFEVSEDWASRHENHRRTIRHHLFNHLSDLGWSPSRGVLEPGSERLASDPPLSLSHCPAAGGFAYLSPESNTHVGFDVEDPDRVTVEVVARISRDEEVQMAPDPASLWVAKEATYKALPKEIQPLVIGQIEIHNWLTLGHNFYTFTGGVFGSQHFRNAQGLVLGSGGLKMGFFLFPA